MTHTHDGFISPCDSEYCDVLDRILEQAMKGLRKEGVPDTNPGLYDLTIAELRLGNIAAICRAALR